MSLSTHTLKRLPYIKQGFSKGLSRTQIGATCKQPVTEKTIDRDVHAWVQSGLFEIWLKTEFAELHHYARQANPMEAYKEIAKIVGKMVTHKAEIKSEHRETVTKKYSLDINRYTEDERNLIRKVLRATREGMDTERPDSIH